VTFNISTQTNSELSLAKAGTELMGITFLSEGPLTTLLSAAIEFGEVHVPLGTYDLSVWYSSETRLFAYKHAWVRVNPLPRGPMGGD
jgi:hypothetical protein